MRSCQKKRRLRVDEKCAGSHCPFQTRCDSIRGKCDSVQCDFVQQCRSLHLNNMPHWRWPSGRDMLEGLHYRKEQHLGIVVTLLNVECARFVQCVLGTVGALCKSSAYKTAAIMTFKSLKDWGDQPLWQTAKFSGKSNQGASCTSEVNNNRTSKAER